MAWNQPGEDKKRPPSRGAPEHNSLDELRQRLQREVQRLWRPGSSRRTLGIAALLVFALWLATGYCQIGPSERGVVQRFGRFVALEQPGHLWLWPRPIETVTKLDVVNPEALDAKSQMLTADHSLIDVSWSVQYRISDPLHYLFHVRDPQESLRQASEAVVRGVVGASTVATLLDGEARARLATEARAGIQKALDGFGAGMSLGAVSIADPRLPDPVQAAQRDANKAVDERQHAISDAEAYRNDIVPKAQSVAQRQISEAQVYSAQTRAAADGEAQRFTQLAQAYAKAPEITRTRMYLDTIEGIFAHAHKIIIDVRTGNGSGNVISIPLDKLAEAIRNGAAAGGSAPASAPASAAAPSPAGAAAPSSSQSADDSHSRDRPER
jgi:membrane protease subunit HflK